MGVNMQKVLGIVVGSLFVVASSVAEPDKIEKLSKGGSIWAAAELGTSKDILGMGYEKNLSSFDANGDVHRVFQNKFVEVPVNQYESRFEVVDNSLLLEAHGRFLFARAGIKIDRNRRYMVVRVHQITNMAKLVLEDKPISAAPMYASKIYYGWALYIVIEGESSVFTSELAASLAGAGAKLGTLIKESRLKSEIHLIGLDPKEGGDIPIVVTAEEVKNAFTIGSPQPIFVEYALQQDLVADSISWAKNEFKPGRYSVDVEISLMENKANGKPWDVGSLPDPLVTLIVNQKNLTSCKQQDSMESRCLSGRVIDIDDETIIGLSVAEADIAADDPVGWTSPLKVMSSGETPGAQITLKTTNQLRSARIKLTPITR